MHYVASNDAATYTGAQAVWALSEIEAERKARALLEPYCANPLTGNLRLVIGAIIRHEWPTRERAGARTSIIAHFAPCGMPVSALSQHRT